MTAVRRRALTFRWAVEDVSSIRAAHLAARRVYRSPSPDELSLTLSALTQTAFRVARHRASRWWPQVLVPPAATTTRESFAVTWDADAVRELEDDWDDLSQLAMTDWVAGLASPQAVPLVRVSKGEVARAAILDGLSDWPSWVHSAPNDPRRKHEAGVANVVRRESRREPLEQPHDRAP